MRLDGSFSNNICLRLKLAQRFFHDTSPLRTHCLKSHAVVPMQAA